MYIIGTTLITKIKTENLTKVLEDQLGLLTARGWNLAAPSRY
jgi:hypothetical protein